MNKQSNVICPRCGGKHAREAGGIEVYSSDVGDDDEVNEFERVVSAFKCADCGVKFAWWDESEEQP